WSRLTDDGKIEVRNENFFTDLSAYRLKWEIIADGERVDGGMINDLDVAPQQTCLVEIPFVSCLRDEREYFLNIYFELKSDQPLLKAGHIAAKQQIAVPDSLLSPGTPKPVQIYRGSSLMDVSVPAEGAPDDYIEINSSSMSLFIDIKTGLIKSWTVYGKEMLAEGAKITPVFWRAPTDNDYGANLQKKLAVWKDPGLKLKSLSEKDAAFGGGFRAEFELTNVGGLLTIDYELYANSCFCIAQTYKADSTATHPGFFRFGLQIPLKSSLENIRYYGRGPGESYVDRHESEFIGIYEQSVTSQYYPYIRPQETGNKTDVRWFTLTDDKGYGIQAYSKKPFNASALHYTIESLDEGPEKHNLHNVDIAPSNLTNLLLDNAHLGLGCVNSWGAIPEEEYLLPYGDYSFTIVFCPIKKKQK
nr:DUF4981 domain-containing protein [Bacteroidales bacterium]